MLSSTQIETLELTQAVVEAEAEIAGTVADWHCEADILDPASFAIADYIDGRNEDDFDETGAAIVGVACAVYL